MNQTRFRQIARLEQLAQPYIQRKQQIEKEWQRTRRGAAANAAVLAFVIRYGDPQIGEPLSRAWERFINSHVWTECCDNWEAIELEQLEWNKYGVKTPPSNCFVWGPRPYQSSPHSRDGVFLTGAYLRHELIARFSGATGKQKLEGVFASAPPWLMWFAFADYTAELLGLSLPDLSSVVGFARSKTDFDNWYGLPSGPFVPRPWPDGPDNEPLSRTDLTLLRPTMERPINPTTRRERKVADACYMKSRSDNEPLSRTDLTLLRPTMERPINPTTRRERKLADASYMKSRSAEPIDDWPHLTRLEILLSFYSLPILTKEDCLSPTGSPETVTRIWFPQNDPLTAKTGVRVP
jgi:hypothetical protein